jgi:hypothetical protein
LLKLFWAIAIGRRVPRGEMDPIARRLGRLWRSLGRGEKKRYYRWKTANLILRDALRMRGVIAIERISGKI